MLITEEESDNNEAMHHTGWALSLPDSDPVRHYPLGTTVEGCQTVDVAQGGIHFSHLKKQTKKLKESNLESGCFSLGSHLTRV